MPIQRTGLLIVRAWVEAGSAEPLRARIQITDDLEDGFRTAFHTKPEAVELMVAQWLQDVLRVR